MKTLIDPLFQPIADANGAPYAYEALLRIKGALDTSPLPHIKRWEKTGFIHAIDLAMLDCITAAVVASEWHPALAVNVSVATVESDATAYLDGLQRLAAHSGRVIVELTETAQVRDVLCILRFASACRAGGHMIALDDCRPGHLYGSAPFMQSIRPDIVKIDGPFVRECFQNDEVAELRGMIDLAHSVGAQVVAEHISSLELRDFAFELGADLVQGYAIGMPQRLPQGERLHRAFH